MASLSHLTIEHRGASVPGFGYADMRPFNRDEDIAASSPLAPLADTGHARRAVIHLGVLEVRPGSRTLLVDGVAVELGGRGFDLLMVLLDARGEIVSKETLLRQVWPTVTVVDSNLKVQLSLLRRALGPERWRIKTVAGRGYLLATDDGSAASPPNEAAPGDRRLVIVIDADRSTQEMVVRALSDVARYFDGVTRLALVSRDREELALAS